MSEETRKAMATMYMVFGDEQTKNIALGIAAGAGAIGIVLGYILGKVF